MPADPRQAGAPAETLASAAQPAKLAPAARPLRWRSRLARLAMRALPRSVLVREGDIRGRRIALTFDDGPHEMTDAYLDVLARFDARATFFVVGAASAARRDALTRIADRGHELAGHGFTHKPFTGMSNQVLRDELSRTAALLPPARTPRPLVRPPRGSTSVRSLMVCATAGYTTVLWSRDSDDCRTSSADAVAAQLAPDALRPGDILLLHEGQTWTLEALPRVLDNLTRAGWQMVTAGELLGSPS
jgi:peptidoglycan/xylan/chitin deacetylase (PgdA/CDA1 family)